MKDNFVAVKQLDRQFVLLKKLRVDLIPKQGWVRTLRKALGLTIRQLSKRLGVNSSRVVKIETAEIEGGITLKTLKIVAASLDCQFIYGFIPNSSLEEIVKARAKKIAIDQIKRSSHTMDLEAQSVNKQWLEEQIHALTQELLNQPWKYLWEE